MAWQWYLSNVKCQKTGFRRERAHKRVYSVLLLLCVGCSISIERQMLWLLSHLLDQIAVAHITHDILFFVSPASISLSLFSYHTYRCDPPMQAGTTKLIAIQCTIFPCQTIIIIFLHVLADHEILSGGCRPRPHNDTHLDSNMSVLHAGPEEHVTSLPLAYDLLDSIVCLLAFPEFLWRPTADCVQISVPMRAMDAVFSFLPMTKSNMQSPMFLFIQFISYFIPVRFGSVTIGHWLYSHSTMMCCMLSIISFTHETLRMERRNK